ncbi:hypothetical protein AGMMS50276_33270 [Synergistales bacterium]|nr:hypothetical protein AGMMS50276_33270 [Synergistales bacterium]
MVAGVVSDADFIDIRMSTKKELLEYRYGYSEKGYVDMCRRCAGIGDGAKTCAPAVQIPKAKR